MVRTMTGKKTTEVAVGRRILSMTKRTLFYVVMLGLAFLSLLPFIWMISTSLKDVAEVFVYPPTLIPKRLAFENYIEAWKAAPFARFMINSVVHSSLVTLSHIITSCLAAYAFARLNFWGRDKIFLLYLGTMMIPTQVTLIPAFIIVRNLGWIDSFYGLIIPNGASVLGVFLLRQFFLGIPGDLEDAAKLDGCGPLRTLWAVFVPLAKPALTTLALFSFMQTWNSFFWPLIVTNTSSMRTLQIGLRYFMDSDAGNIWNLLMASSVIVMAPVIAAFLLAQRNFIEGITLTGIKG